MTIAVLTRRWTVARAQSPPRRHPHGRALARTGSEAQIATAQKILAAARRDLYRLLAEDDEDVPGGAGEE